MNKEFEKHVKILKKNGSDILKEIKENEVQVLTNILDTMVHYGDELDASKKQVFYNKALTQNTSFYTKLRVSRYFKELTSEKCDLLHMTVGAVGESTELAHAVLNHVGHLKTLGAENIKEELGDILFYVQGVADSLNLDLKDIMKENIEKLKKRYHQGYSDESAQERKGNKVKVKCIDDKFSYCGLVAGQEYHAVYLNDKKKDVVINNVCLPLSLFEAVEETKIGLDVLDITNQGIKHDHHKLKPALLFDDMPLAINEVLKVLKFGADKYEEGNWLKVDNGMKRYRNASDRHRLQSSLEENDNESGLLHLAHEAVNTLMLLELKLRELDKLRRND